MGTEGTVVEGGYTLDERSFLLQLARQSLVERAAGKKIELNEELVSSSLREKRGCFVTLFKAGELRGCVGHVLPQMKLYAAVAHNACAAGFHDSRFEPVSPPEVPDLEIEISVLSSLQAVAPGPPEKILSALRLNVDGVLLRQGSEMTTFLPQVWFTVSDKEEFLSRLCQKAGWSPQAWRAPDVSISKYQVVSFGESPDARSPH